MSKISFLTPDKPDFEQIRHQIRGILDSYSHEWDLLSELAQNAIDAISAAGLSAGLIDVTVDAAKREVTFEDNGSGIEKDDIARLMRPFNTNKIGKPNQIGQKGVGLKFVIFTSSHFELSTRTQSSASCAIIVGASGWSRVSEDRALELDLQSTGDKSKTGTKVIVQVDSEDHPIFDYSFKDLVFLLRTKTALGNANFIWGAPLNVKFSLTHIDKGGKRKADTFDCRYLLPTEVVSAKKTENLKDFLAWLKDDPNRSDQEKRRRLVDKIIYSYGEKEQSGRTIRYWSCYVPSRSTWTDLSRFQGLTIGSEGDLESGGLPGIGFEGGFQVITKGMPTGISIPLKPRGQGSYLPHFFFVVDDPSLNFDIGRKSVHGRQQGMLKELAFESFNAYLNDVQKHIGSGGDLFENIGTREEAFEQIASLPDLQSALTAFAKRPNVQEATVAAMFFEQIGKGSFADVKPLLSGYARQYDLYAKWKKKSFVIEFKFTLEGLFKDFGDEKKIFSDVNAVVLWEITERDRVVAKKHGITLELLEKGTTSQERAFPHSTYLMTMGPTTGVFIVEMKEMLQAH